MSALFIKAHGLIFQSIDTKLIGGSLAILSAIRPTLYHATKA